MRMMWTWPHQHERWTTHGDDMIRWCQTNIRRGQWEAWLGNVMVGDRRYISLGFARQEDHALFVLTWP